MLPFPCGEGVKSAVFVLVAHDRTIWLVRSGGSSFRYAPPYFLISPREKRADVESLPAGATETEVVRAAYSRR